MKKTIIALMGLFTLIACSEDSYQEADKMNETVNVENGSGGMQTNSFDRNYDTPFPGMPGYFSPWDIWRRDKIFTHYEILNGHFGASQYKVYVTAYVGLGYYDSDNNGVFYDVSIPSTGLPGQLIADMTNGNYPNLFNNNSNNEIGALIESVELEFDGSTPEQREVSIDSSKSHCPVIGGEVGNGWNPRGLFFELRGATPEEVSLLANYGKVFFYKVRVTDQLNNLLFENFLQIENIAAGNYIQDWIATGVPGVAPDYSGGELFYQYTGTGTVFNMGMGGNISDSREVDFGFKYPSSYSVPGGPTISAYRGYGTTYWEGSGCVIMIE